MSNHTENQRPQPRGRTSIFAQTWIFLAIGAVVGALVGSGIFATQTHRWVDSRWPVGNQPETMVDYLSTMGVEIDSDDFRAFGDSVCDSMDEFVPEDTSSATAVWGQLADQKADEFFTKDSFSTDADLDSEPLKDALAHIAVEAAVTQACPQYLPDMYAYSQNN